MSRISPTQDARICDCPSPASQSLGVNLAVPVEAVQEVPTLEQFQRWLETEAHRALNDSTIDVLHLVRCRAAMCLLTEFKGQA